MKHKIFLFAISVFFIGNLFATAPTITSFSPSSGAVGTLVTITGTDLSTPTAFTIGGAAAIVVSNSGTTLVGMVMPGAVTGTIVITTAGGTATSSGNFTVTATVYPDGQQGSKLVGTDISKAGTSVSVSADGNTAIVGGPYENYGVGAAWIYTRSQNTWSQQGSKLVGSGGNYSGQGSSVAISADGNTAIVGGYHDGVNGATYQGAAWVWIRSGNTWSQQGNKLVGTGGSSNAEQGTSVALSADGNTAIVGGPLDQDLQVGAAWVFTRSGTTWSQQGNKLVGSGNMGTARQGTSVALSADGNTAMVGGSYDNGLTGAAWIFTRSGTTWTQAGSKLVGTIGVYGTAYQGWSVSLSANGNTAIMGGPFNQGEEGAAWVFTRSGSTWYEQAKLTCNGGSYSHFGSAVSLSADGNTVIVGGSDDTYDNYVGAVWVFTRSGAAWTQHGNKLKGTGNSGASKQGSSVSLSADGRTVMVGGPGDNTNTGASWVFVDCESPAINSQSTATQTLCINGTFSAISVTTTGEWLSYQWYTNASSSNSGGTSLGTGNGAQSNSYTPQASVAGTLYYYCVVTNACGTTATSAVSGAFVTNPATAISSQSTATQTQCISGTFTAITVTATGPGLSYQWYSNASNSNSGGISLGSGNGAQTNSYTPQAAATGTLYYYCVVTGTCGTATSTVSGAFITNEVIAISSQSTAAQTQCISGTFTAITVTATGPGLTYQWYSNATNSNSGGTSLGTGNGAQTYTYIPQASEAGTLYYYCVVTGTCGTATSTVSGAFVTNPATAISSQSTATQTQCISGTFTAITVTATGPGLTYQWYSNATNSNSGGTSLGSGNGAQTYSYTPQALAAGTLYYYCIVTGTCGTATTTVSGAFITNATTISSQSTATQTQCISGTFAAITVTATGPGLTYQWYSNATNSNSGGTSLGSDYGAQTNGYTPQSATAGTLYYYCKVTGTCGTTATSAVSGAFITNATTAINSQSTATQTQCSNGTFSAISVTATGTGSLTYQWYSNASNSNSGGASLGSGNGAQTNSYTPQTSAGGTLYYYCVVTGTCGTATSSVSGAFIVNPLLTVTSFSPNTGPAGTLVTITGTNLNNTPSFTIGGVPALIISNTATTLTGMVMPWSTGTISITNGGCSPVSAGTFTITPTLYPGLQQGEKILGTGNTGAALQGTSVAVSADGNTAIVGGSGDISSQGAVWVYTRSGSTWTQQGDKLVGTGSVGEFVYQGFSVSLSADGNTAMVGGYGDNSNMGAAWVFTRSGSTWTQQGNKLVGTGSVGATVYQGNSVSLSADGNTALVGGYGDNSNQGATWVYTRSGSTWTQQGNKLVGTGSVGEFVYQGFSVSLSGDGNTAIVGGSNNNYGQGAAWLFTRSGSTWTQQGGKLLGAGTVGTDVRQGCSVSLSADGSTAIVGGSNDNYTQGAAWVYAPNMMMGGWAQQGNKLVGTDNTGTAYQGSSVSLSADGSTAIVGGMGDNSNKGAVWVYTRSGQTWSQQDSKLVGTGSVGANVKQGCSVSISADGNTAIVGGYYDNSYQGAAWVFVPCTGATINSQSTAAQAQAVGGTYSAISVTATGTGITYQWYSNASNSNSGGTSLGSGNGAQTNSYTPQSASAGTLYYYCVVTGTCGTATSAVSGAFITTSSPAITSFNPATGPVGTLVTITGTNLNSPTAFTIGGTSALVVTNTGTQLVGFVMPGAATGAISVTTAGGTATSGTNFTVTPTPYPSVQQGNKLVGSNAIGAASQGYSVAVSADGNTAIVGGYSDNSCQGAIWVYIRSSGIWTQQGSKLVGIGNAGATVYQGLSVALSANGNTAMVGGFGDNYCQGAAWVFTRSGSTWSQQGDKLVGTGSVGPTVYQGFSVSLSADGNTALVGGPLDNNNLGATWVYTRSGSTWSEQAKLVGDGSVGSNVHQGSSVSLSANGNTAIVGGSQDANGLGAAWVFTRSGSTWSEQAKLVGDGSVGSDVYQGSSVSLSADGSTAIVGGTGDNSGIGAAWVYTYSGSTWTQQGNKLLGTGGTILALGCSVAISADGNTAIVGGHNSDNNQGATWVYTRTTGNWSQQGSKLVGTGGTAYPQQGISVALSADGNTAIVGGYADNSDQGAAWVFIVNPPTWTGTTSTDWNTASNWSPAAVPTAGANATIPSAPVNQPQVNNDPGSPAICNNLTIQTGAVLTIAPGKALTVNNTLTNNAGTGGLIVQSDASGTGSLIHNSDAVDATIQRYISGSGTLTDMQYHFVSVPLVTATASTSNLFLDSYLFDYTQASGTWNALGSATTNNLDETRGYMIYYPGTSKTYSFAGQLNNGAFTALTSYTLGQGYNLVPNPYPSAIDWMGSGWTKTAIADATYIWPAGADGLSTNYSSFVAGVGSNAGTRYIPAGQAFFVQATGSSPVLTMTNATRVHNAQAFWKEGEQISDLLRIKAVAVHNQAFDELVVHFREGASANFDIDFDANKLRGGEDAPQFSSVAADNSRLSINSLPFSGGDIIVPLAFSLNTGSDVTLSASGMGSFYESIPIYLEDLTTNTITDLRVNPVYTFSHAAGDNENRFRLRFKGVTGTPEHPITTPGNIFISQGQLFVDVPSMNQLPATLAVYDALGRQFSSRKVTLNGIMQCTAPSIPGVYVVRLIAGSRSFTGKVVVGK